MQVGFTGTSRGMNQRQINTLIVWLTGNFPEYAHHGDCIGADAEFHDLVRNHVSGCTIYIHPPADSKKRAWMKGDVTLSTYPYLERNHNIVDASEIMLAAPATYNEQLRSGTWATVRYARRKSKPVILFYP